jgi:hypothetical protein
MNPHRIEDERAFADTQEVPVVADPDLCAEDDALPETVRDGGVFRALTHRRGNLVVE